MEEIIQILMRRDEIDRDTAIQMVQACQFELDEAVECGDYEMAQDIVEMHLGLEPDFIPILIL